MIHVKVVDENTRYLVSDGECSIENYKRTQLENIEPFIFWRAVIKYLQLSPADYHNKVKFSSMPLTESQGNSCDPRKRERHMSSAPSHASIVS